MFSCLFYRYTEIDYMDGMSMFCGTVPVLQKDLLSLLYLLLVYTFIYALPC